MSRSLFKGFVIKNYLLTYLRVANQKKKIKKTIFVKQRNQIVIPQFLGQNLLVHNGKEKIPLLITPEMIGFKFGEFISTRVNFKFIKKNKKKNR